MELHRLVLAAALLISFYVNSVQSVQCWSCDTGSKSKSRNKDTCHPDRLTQDKSKSSKEAGKLSNCNYCVAITTHYNQGSNDYFEYNRACRTTHADCAAATASTATTRLVLGLLDFASQGYTTTTHCCDAADGDLCNSNSATARQMGVLSMLVAMAMRWVA